MERLTSRKNPLIAHMRALGADKSYRHAHGEFLCDGTKLLGEALRWGAEITALLWASDPVEALACPVQVVKGRCPYNPLAKCRNITCQNEELSYAAGVAMIMFYYKLRDTLHDEGFW